MRWISVVALSLLLLVPQTGMAQATGTISGALTGTGGQPLAGASVAVTGTTLGTQTGADGRFTITGVPAGARTLRATFAGYTEATRPVTVVAGQTATVNIQLSAQVFQLEGVVATGYATQRRQDVTGAVSTLQTENIQGVPLTGATQALIGQIPGVNVITSTGAPGSGAQIQIRGNTAVGAGSTPLYVVDGFPITGDNASGQIGFTNRNPLNDIPPQDIESITVLKDASAAAIYGSRASNGVVIITTKRGRATDVPQIAINAYTGTQRADWSTFPELANANEFAQFMLRRGRQRLAAGLQIDVDSMFFVRQLRGENGPGTDWFREVVQDAPMSEVNASISGGTERVRAYFSGGFLNQKGLVLNSGYNRASVRANLEASVRENMTLTFSLAPTYSTRKLATTGGTNRTGGFGQTLVVWPIDYNRDPVTDTINHLVRGATTVGVGTANPAEILRNQSNDQRTLRMLGSTALSWELLEGLTWRTSLNADWQSNQTENFSPSSIWNASGPTVPSGNAINSGYLSYLNENTLTLGRIFRDEHRVQALVGFTAQEEISRSLTTSGSNFPDDDIRTLNAANTIQIPNNGVGEDEWTLASVLGRVNYTLLDRYVLTATMRADGSSRFGANRRWGSFPSAALAWNASRERFFENVTWMQELKLRASVGFTGNNQIGNYPSLGIVNRSDYVFGSAGTQAAGRRLTTLQNPELSWEKTRELNFGVDASVLDYRATVTADVYRRNTTNLLLSLELPTASGFGSVTANQGEIENTGFEIGLNTTNLDGRRLRWTSNANLSVNRNKAINLGASDTLLTGASMEGGSLTHISVVGQPLARFFGYKTEGIYTEQDIQNACVANVPMSQQPNCVPIYPTARPTDIRYADINGDGIITQVADFTVIGDPSPDFTWGMTHTVSYGPASLRFTLDGAVGGDRLQRTLASTENIDGIFNVTRDYVQNMWISPDSVGDGRTPSAGFSSGEGRRRFRDVNDRWVEDASYVWLRNVNLRYTLPQFFNARNASVYVTVANPMIWSGFRGNPQTQTSNILGGSSPNLTPGVDEFSYPIARTFTVGIDLGL